MMFAVVVGATCQCHTSNNQRQVPQFVEAVIIAIETDRMSGRGCERNEQKDANQTRILPSALHG
jgi:hypothetical protein